MLVIALGPWFIILILYTYIISAIKLLTPCFYLTFGDAYLCLQTSSFYIHIFKVQLTEKNIHVGGKQPTRLSFANISLVLSEQVPFANGGLTV